MGQYLYLCATPESLIASQLPPLEFGSYLACGTKKRTHGQAVFFEVDMAGMNNLPIDYMNKRLVPYSNGEPKRSVFLSIYRVMENVPMDALKNLYLVTDDGKVLGIQAGNYQPAEEDVIHLYQQFNPIRTRVASKLSPPEFIEFLTDTSKPVSTPKLLFAELKLNQLARDPNAPIQDLPYPNPGHLRDCIRRLNESTKRRTKTVLREFRGEISYRTIKGGFYYGEGKTCLFYPFPDEQDLDEKYHNWWRSALVECF